LERKCENHLSRISSSKLDRFTSNYDIPWFDASYVIAQSELTETTAQLKTCQEQLVKALADVSRISDELLHHQQLLEQSEKQRKLLETQLKDAEAKLDAVQTENAYSSKKIADTLEQRVRVIIEFFYYNTRHYLVIMSIKNHMITRLIYNTVALNYTVVESH